LRPVLWGPKRQVFGDFFVRNKYWWDMVAIAHSCARHRWLDHFRRPSLHNAASRHLNEPSFRSECRINPVKWHDPIRRRQRLNTRAGVKRRNRRAVFVRATPLAPSAWVNCAVNNRPFLWNPTDRLPRFVRFQEPDLRPFLQLSEPRLIIFDIEALVAGPYRRSQE